MAICEREGRGGGGEEAEEERTKGIGEGISSQNCQKDGLGGEYNLVHISAIQLSITSYRALELRRMRRRK